MSDFSPRPPDAFGMAYIPWRRIASWSCTSCGLCCMRFAVFLTKAERDQMVAHFGRKVVLEHHSGPRLGKVGRRCFFQRWTDETSNCLLQNTDLKPSACRIFPFLASPKPLRDRHAKESFFTLGDQELYIYANRLHILLQQDHLFSACIFYACNELGLETVWIPRLSK